MKYKELITEVADNIEFKLTPNQLREILDTCFETIADEVFDEGEVSVSGFGKFYLDIKQPCTRRNPKTGERVEVPETRKLKFRPSSNNKVKISD